ncbi:fumarylacetoacetate hydrolase family protein [Actinoalloteichus hymeniacidonis]|uniref:Fumarylacetoacetate hydrolase n=1 Tax=Actinoalloteichus hymeniacidonis TaxID=340345 RepID=A0AAC9MV85_9PSEU|nr:fumarylacetoacetate hydrolase family protein [Actinoalloteichus hymeniacidonis]AOS60958.1 fumarylacetoacetate hydrolase [Actinoalloteichus hymeniacidonis]MBB5911042.1 fumarylacetoacetase [Actinoalloteichus hymeniacidonis]
MSWIDVPGVTADAPFGPQTLPYGRILAEDGGTLAVRVGDHALPLRPLAAALGPRLGPLTETDTLDPLLASDAQHWSELRERLREITTATTAPPGARLVPLDGLRLGLPFTVADYVDFYSSRHHAENVGRILRPDSEPLLPNWTHLPVGYHGRAGTVVVSGTDVVRPHGQRRRTGTDTPAFGPTRRLDIEAEVGFVCGGPTEGRLSTERAEEHVFGVALVNDWSARDIQAWEYQPLGPFLGKSFATSISGWITPLQAFDHARVPTPAAPHPLADYLVETRPAGLELRLRVEWNGTVVSEPNFAVMSWSFCQQLAHLSVNGATVRPGDLIASGTVSGPARTERGSFLELSWGGREDIDLGPGVRRTFLEDGDSVVITATAPGPADSIIGLGEVAGTIRPAAPA